MSVDKKDFLTSKFNNFVTWLQNDKVLPKNHELLKKLKSYDNYEKLLSFVNIICNIADDKGNIPIEYLSEFLNQYNINIKSFKDEQIDKFNRYLKCFILVSTH